jgi:hypothetical protein
MTGNAAQRISRVDAVHSQLDEDQPRPSPTEIGMLQVEATLALAQAIVDGLAGIESAILEMQHVLRQRL